MAMVGIESCTYWANKPMRFHQYADDSQIYISTTVSEEAPAVQRFTACVKAINDWMPPSRLKLNPTKTGSVAWIQSTTKPDQHY